MSDMITNDGELIEFPEAEIDNERLKRMIIRIYGAERDNTKTAKYGEHEMKDMIKNIIESEVKKCY